MIANQMLAARRVNAGFAFSSTWKVFSLWFCAHAMLGILFRYSGVLSTLHALVTLLVALLFVFRDRTPERAILITGYIAGAEILWRMTGASLFWEFGKYAISLIMLLIILRWRLKLSVLPVLYFAFLIPSTVITFVSSDLGSAREAISFNLSGALAVMLVALVARRIYINRGTLLRLIAAICGPLVGIMSNALFSTISTRNISFSGASNFVTSGGYGPNQVSASLGFGALLCWVLLLLYPKLRISRWIFAALMLLFIGQSVMTFSRGGLANFLIAVPLPSLLLLRSKSARSQGTVAVIFLLIAAAYFIFPYLDRFTGETLSQRFTDTNMTGRDSLVETDISLFVKNPLFGVGVGRASNYYTDLLGRTVAAHTELSRLLAEHGIFGILSFLFFIGGVAQSYIRNKKISSKSIILFLALWAMAEMSHSAMRIALISLALGLTLASYDLDEKTSPRLQ